MCHRPKEPTQQPKYESIGNHVFSRNWHRKKSIDDVNEILQPQIIYLLIHCATEKNVLNRFFPMTNSEVAISEFGLIGMEIRGLVNSNVEQ